MSEELRQRAEWAISRLGNLKLLYADDTLLKMPEMLAEHITATLHELLTANAELRDKVERLKRELEESRRGFYGGGK